MMTSLWPSVALCFLAGQASVDGQLDEPAFRRAVAEGWPVSQSPAASQFALAHTDVAVPVLVSAVKPRLIRGESDWFVSVALDWITRYAPQRSVDAVAELCTASQESCPSLVNKLLASAAARERHYEVAYEASGRHPILLTFVAQWVTSTLEASIKSLDTTREFLRNEEAAHPSEERNAWLQELTVSTQEKAFTQELLRREQAGHVIAGNDPLWLQLPPNIRGQIAREIEEQKADNAFDAAAFQEEVAQGGPRDYRYRMANFAWKNEAVGIPILADAIKSKWNDPQAQEFVHMAVRIVIQNRHERGADTVLSLCATAEGLCSWMIERLLDDSAQGLRPYAMAYYIVDRNPKVLDFVTPWVIKKLGDPILPPYLAREIAERETKGHLVGDDPILPRLPESVRQIVNEHVTRMRATLQ